MRILVFLLLLFPTLLNAQLRPGYSAEENLELLKVFKSFVDRPTAGMDVPASTRFHRVYRSPMMGLENMWELHADSTGTAVINLRGTTENGVSWLENGYAAMVPASGTLKLDATTSFNYHLADDPRAAVHVGWLVGMAFLQGDILPRIDSLYRAGTRDIFITGHSQGGALCYLLTAHLWQLQRTGRLPREIRFKSYVNAGPKPGNTAFAQHYEHYTRGWAFNTVNAVDWVPEMPMSIQTVTDFNIVNPFVGAKKNMGALPLKARLISRHVYNKLDKPTRKAQRNFRKFLGGSAGKIVRRTLPLLETPPYAETSNYVRTGTIITLLPDSGYYERFPQKQETPFVNHMLEPYVYLMERYTPDARNAFFPPEPAPADPNNAPRERRISDGIGFHSMGHDPEWMLDINPEKGMGWRNLEDGQSWFVSAVEPSDGADQTEHIYRSETERGLLLVSVKRNPCTDAKSGELLPYSVRLEMKDSTGERSMEGCGEYLPPQRLYDIWMLYSMNGERISPAELQEGARLEFNTTEGTVLGGSGCNGFTARFEATRQGIIFGEMALSKMKCSGYPAQVEQDFLAALRSGELKRMFRGNELFLTTSAGTILVFRRVD